MAFPMHGPVQVAMRPVLLALVLLAASTAAQVPVPGVVPTLSDAADQVGDATGADGVSKFAVDTFHGLATPPARQPHLDEPAPINDAAWEVARSAGMDVTMGVHSALEAAYMDGFQIGGSYTLTVSGTYAYWADGGPGWGADAECSISPSDPYWKPARYGARLLDLYAVDEDTRDVAFDWVPADPWPAGSGHDPACSRNHNYTVAYSPSAQWARFVVDDYRPDNRGTLHLGITGPAPQYVRYYSCGKHAIEAWSGSDTVGDLESATIYVDSRRNANDLPYPHLVPGVAFWQEAGHNGIYTCNMLVPWSTYNITVTGTYTYLEKNPLDRPTDLLPPDGVWVGWDYVRPRDYGPSLGVAAPLADAECSQGLADPLWLSHREDHVLFTGNGEAEIGTDYLDLTLNELWVKWFPANGKGSGCDETHTYFIEDYRPDRLGPLHLWLKDARYAEHDNRGHLAVTITRTS
jgi:hypothetical protein